jgi:predicted AAA+ superfamily ATPase
MLNYQNMADELEISLNTVKNWVSLLEATGLVFILQPFTNSALNRAIKTPKFYFRDTGLVCFLTKWSNPETAKRGAMARNLFETFVVSEILKSFSNEGLDYRFRVSYYRGKDKSRRKQDGEVAAIDSEIDLIIEENGLFHPIEIKMTANPKAHMAAAFQVLDKIPGGRRGDGAVICMYDKPLTLRDTVQALPISYL